MKTYTVLVTEDHDNNMGDPISSESYSFELLSDANKKYESELIIHAGGNGINRYVELCESNEYDPEEDGFDENYDIDPLYTQLKSDYCDSPALPKDGVIVYYCHVTYMGYAYAIDNIELVSNSEFKNYSDLPYSDDHIHTTWARVYKSVEDMQEAYENGYSQPFDKLQKGRRIVEEFLAEQGIEEYIKESEEE